MHTSTDFRDAVDGRDYFKRPMRLAVDGLQLAGEDGHDGTGQRSPCAQSDNDTISMFLDVDISWSLMSNITDPTKIKRYNNLPGNSRERGDPNPFALHLIGDSEDCGFFY